MKTKTPPECLKIWLLGYTPWIACVGLAVLVDGHSHGERWNFFAVIAGTVTITALVWSQPWRWSVATWVGMLFWPGIWLAAAWKVLVGLYGVGALAYMVLFVVAMLYEGRRRERRDERDWMASPYWRVPRTATERRLNAELQGFIQRPEKED